MPTMATTGALFVFSRLPGLTQAASRAQRASKSSASFEVAPA